MRMYMMNPSDEEHYYLYLLLHYVKGATSYKDVKTFDGKEYANFNDTRSWRWFLIENMVWRDVLREWSRSNFVSLTELYGTILVHFFPSEPIYIYHRNRDIILQDFTHRTGRIAPLCC